jgi:hypothetical protein
MATGKTDRAGNAAVLEGDGRTFDEVGTARQQQAAAE